MDLGIQGKAALVACASSGLGLGVARALAAEGAHVSICARGGERLAAAHRELDSLGQGKVRSESVDMSDSAAVARWVENTREEFGAVDIVISHTGGVQQGTVGEFGVDDYRTAVGTTMLPHMALVVAATPYLKENGWGRLVLITSESVHQPMPHNVLSGVARTGLHAYARNLADDFGRTGVTVNVLVPGYHRTPALRGPGGTDPDRAAREVPLGRVGDPDDFGALAAFLVSARAAFVTGAQLLVDGGNTRAPV